MSFFNNLNCAGGRASSPSPPRGKKPTRRKKPSTPANPNNGENYYSAGPSAPPLQQNNNVKRSSTSESYGVETSGKSFYELGGYRIALKRCDNGAKLGKELEDMIAERAKIEDSYASSIRSWYKKWTTHLNKNSSEKQTTRDAWQAYLDLSNNIATVHDDLCKDLINGPVAKTKEWLKKNYGKHFVNYKQTKSFEEDFERAEQSYAEQFEKLKKFKKEYYDSIKATKASEETARAAQTNPKTSDDQRQKLADKAKGCREEQDRARQNYQNKVREIALYKDKHMEVMREVFEKTQSFDKERMMFFKQTFLECDELMQMHNDPRHKLNFDEYVKRVNRMDPKCDLEWWSKYFGVDTEPNWPDFEEYEE